MVLNSVASVALGWAAVLAIFTHHAHSATAPNQCSYVKDNLFTCDYSAMATASDRPINFADFDPVPQRLVVTINGLMPYFGENETFSSGFSSINTALFDANFPAELTLDCGRDGIAYLNSGALAYMGYVQSLKFKNCKVYQIPASVFADIAELDYFGFEGGEIGDGVISPNAMVGLNLETLTSATHSFPRQRGHFEVMYSTFTGQSVPVGLLYSWKNLTSVTIKGTGITSLTLDVFKYNTKLRHIDLSDNAFTSLPVNMFSGLDALTEVTLYNIPWSCDCSNLWFVGFAISNNISLVGDLICDNANGQTIYKYYHVNCVTDDPCTGLTGVAIGQNCVSALFLTIFVLTFATVVLATVALVIVLKTRRDYTQKDKRRRQAVGKWHKVLENSIKMKRRN